MSNLFKVFNPSFIITRNVKKRYSWPNAIQYDGFKYYPRYENFADPPYEPTKLFRVQRIHPIKGVPHYEKKVLKDFKLDGKQSDVVIVKNTPETNQYLYKIKHLVQIHPITFPDGFPKDGKGAFLKENGELVIKHEVFASAEKMQLAEEFRKAQKRIDGDTLRRDSRQKWLTGWQ